MPKLATTLILCKNNHTALPHSAPLHGFSILMVKRSLKSRFFPGAHVFPGGLLEEVDKKREWVEVCKSSSSVSTLSDFERGLRVGCLRELFEETNLLLSKPRATAPEHIRKKVQEDASAFLSYCTSHNLSLDLDLLHPYSHWITPEQEKWRYDTHFFVATLPDSYDFQLKASNETLESSWFTPQEALQSMERGDIRLPPPTWFVIRHLSQFSSLANLVEHCEMHKSSISPIQPVLHPTPDGRLLICMPGDEKNHGSPGAIHRIVVSAGKYEYLNSMGSKL
uniref:Nudix hydrolase domain-containing protein n=1 Tax=Arcella intermedia TaxID=1963864 RepID=A0A6B2LCK6_9EUKA